MQFFLYFKHRQDFFKSIKIWQIEFYLLKQIVIIYVLYLM